MTMRLKPEVAAAFAALPGDALNALETLLEGVNGKDEYVAEQQDDYGSYDCDEGLTDWDIDISERADSLISALADQWRDCKHCGAEVKWVYGEGVEPHWTAETTCTETKHEGDDE